MKKIALYISIVCTVVFVQACKKGGSDPTPTNNTTTNQDLLNTWKVSQVLEGSLDITGEFTQYRITFAESNGQKNFTLVDRQGTSTNGTWTISTNNTTITLSLSDSNSITLNGVSINASQLKYTADEQGKTGAVNLSFTLVPA